jgi:hypothetical protein
VWLEHAPDRLGRHQRRHCLVKSTPFAELSALVDLSRGRPEAGHQEAVGILNHDAKKATRQIAIREPETRHGANLILSEYMARSDVPLQVEVLDKTAGIDLNTACSANKLFGMGIGRIKCGSTARGFWPRLTAIAVAYTLIIQAFFIVFVGTQLTAGAADNGSPGFELCLHGPQDGPSSPVDGPGHQGGNHCAFCFTGAFQSLAAPPPSRIQHIEINAGVAWWVPLRWLEPQPYRFAIARPRGPPLSA